MLFLVVDDDPLSRELITLLLQGEGYGVEAFASGDQSLSRVANRALPQPAVILTDLQMPGLASDALAKALRAKMPTGTMLIAMSGSRPNAAILQNFDAFLMKPFQVGELKSITARPPEIVGGDAASSTYSGELTAKVLDEDIYAKLAELMPAEQLGQMYALCVGDARKRILHMRALAETGNDVEYRAEAHTVKGGSGMIGARQLYEFAAAAERDGIPTVGIGSGTSGVTTALAQLSLACDRLERILVERTRE